MKNKMIVLLGKTCAGKTTSGNILSEKYGFKKAVTYTTRPMRPGEVEGVDYFFVDDETFLKMREDKLLAEHAEYDVAGGFHWYYGSSVESYGLPGKNYIILNPVGFKMVKENNVDAITILLDLSEDQIRERLKERKDNKSEAERRILADRKDFDGLRGIDYTISCDGLSPEAVADKINEIYLLETIGSESYFTDVFRAFNSFGSAKKIADDILDQNKDINIAFFALTALYLAFQYKKLQEDGNTYMDERDLASKKYATKNHDAFLKIFKDYAGFEPAFTTDSPFTYEPNSSQFRGTVFEKWAKKIVNEHPTLRQSYMRGFVGAIGEELGLPDGTFPLI